jgi:hypothetical protein
MAARYTRILLTVASINAAAACGSNVTAPATPAAPEEPRLETTPPPVDSVAPARGPGMFGSGN